MLGVEQLVSPFANFGQFTRRDLPDGAH
jgi:hypothetical protein